MAGHPAKLALANGKVFTGQAFGAEGEVDGEVVFNTSMTGRPAMSEFSQGPRVESPQLKTHLKAVFTIPCRFGKVPGLAMRRFRENQMIADKLRQCRFLGSSRLFSTT